MKVLTDLEFQNILSETYAQTSTGSEILKNYKAHLMNNPVTCGVVNSFIKEAQGCRYDSGINKALEEVTSYIQSNSTGWQIATVCENINNSQSSRNFLNLSAAKQAEKLLEMSEEDINKYIKSGALKNIMYCEAFRNIANNVFGNSVRIVEQTRDYTKFTPASMVENTGDGVAFVVAGQLFVQDENGVVEHRKDWSVVSQTFKIVESLLESNLVEICEDDTIKVSYNNQEYIIKESEGNITIQHGDKNLSIDELREENELTTRIAHPVKKNEITQVLESIAVLAENFDRVASLNNVAIYSTPFDKFMVIESGSQLYAQSIQSKRTQPWKISEDAIKVLEFIKNKTCVMISENYKEAAAKALEEADEQSKSEIEQILRNESILNLKERIELLTEKFKDDPTKLAVLSKCAEEISTI